MLQVRKAILRIHWLLIINQFLGFMLFCELLTLWCNGFFSLHGFSQRLQLLANESQIAPVKLAMHFMAYHSYLFSPVFFLLLLVTSGLLLFLLAKFIANWLATAIFFSYYLAHITHQGTWLFEFILPTVFCAICAFASSHFARYLSLRHKFFGRTIYNQIKVWVIFRLYIIVAIFLSCVIYLSNNVTHHAATVAVTCGFIYLLSNCVNLYLERFRYPPSQLIKVLPYKLTQQRLINLNKYWLDLFCLILGIMLVCQVYMDQFLNWFTVSGYKNLMHIYAHYTNLPPTLGHLLTYSSRYATILLPLQLAIESFCALCMMLLILRFPILLIAAALFFGLGAVELGIPASWPATAHSEVSWMWVLIAPALICLAAGIYYAALFFDSKTLSARWLGRGASFPLSWHKRVGVSVIVACLTFLAIRLSPSLHAYNKIFALSSSLSVFFYLSLLNVIDLARRTD